MKTDNAAAMEVAANGGGVTATMSTYAVPYLAAGRLVAPFGVGEVLPLSLHAVPNQNRRLTRPAALFMDWLEAEFAAA